MSRLQVPNGMLLNPALSLVTAPGANGPISVTKDLLLVGTPPRIKGDTSNPTIANRLLFQDSGVNQGTSLGAIPSGTGNTSNITAFSASDPDNAALIQLIATPTLVTLAQYAIGTAPHVPLGFNVSGAERMRIDTTGRVGIGGAPVSSQAGDLNIMRTAAPTTGVVYWGNVADKAYLYYDGSNFTLQGGSLTLLTGSLTIPGTLTAGGHVHGNWIYADGNHVMFGNPYTAWFRYNSGDATIESSNYMLMPGLAARGSRISSRNATGGIASTGGSEGQLELNNAGSGAAKIAFHREGVFAGYFGLDTDNVLRYGGWSWGGAAYTLWSSQHFTYGVSAVGSTLVQRSAEGYIYGNYINLSADVQGGAPAYVAGQNGDGFLRWYPKVS